MMASPEGWLEDFGTGQLTNGHAEVKLASDFAEIVDSDLFHVFLTPQGESNSLYVKAKNTIGFEVQEQQGGTSSITFSYRVVAKHRNNPGDRLARIPLPGRPIRRLPSLHNFPTSPGHRSPSRQPARPH